MPGADCVQRAEVALVTGAAQTGGIGAACARALGRRGCAVGLIDRRSTDELAGELEDGGTMVATAILDLADTDAIAPAVNELERRLGETTSILVNCAADIAPGSLEQTEVETWRRVLSVNVVAVALLCRRVAPDMGRRGFGRIVNIASDTFDRPPAAGLAAYISAKGALIGLTRALAHELGPFGITVNAISPGLTDTPSARAGQPAEHFRHVCDEQAIQRTLEPVDYVGILDLLVSPAAGMITGQTIRVDGGLVMV